MFIFIILFILILILVILLSFNHVALDIYGGNKRFKTYRLFGNCIYYSDIRKKLNLLGWKEDRQSKHVSLAYRILHPFVFKNGDEELKGVKKSMYLINAELKYDCINKYLLGSKDRLSNAMKGSPYITHTEPIEDYIWKDNDVVIVREVMSSRQRGIHLIINKEEFDSLRDKYMAEDKRAICSTYIKNPLLYKGKKFHLRTPISIFVDKNGNKKITYMKTYSKISTARYDYFIKKREDYLDEEMNITGAAKTEGLIIWPHATHCEYFNSENFELKYLSGGHPVDVHFFNKCNKSITDAVNSIPLDDVVLYEGRQNAGFYTYGADIMFDDTGHAYILELNVEPRYNAIEWVRENYHLFMKYLTKVYEHHLHDIILPYFRYLKK